MYSLLAILITFLVENSLKTRYCSEYLKIASSIQAFKTKLQSFTKYIEINTLWTNFLFIFMKTYLFFTKRQKYLCPSPYKAMLFPNDHFHSKQSSHNTHNIALSGEGAENRCCLRIFVKDCRSFELRAFKET